MLYGIALSNQINLWQYFKQKNEIRWCETFINRLQSVQDSDDEYDIYVYGEGSGQTIKKNDKTYIGEPWPLNNNNIYPFRSDTIQYFTFAQYLRFWCGFSTNRIHFNELLENDEYIVNMPCYPDDGSIEVINNKVIVKFSEYDKN